MKIKAKINENGFLTDYAIVGDIDNSIEIEIPDDFNQKYYRCYKVENGAATFDENQKVVFEHEILLYTLRGRRTNECFSVINRGSVWYDTLTIEQKTELGAWYEAWLDVTTTLEVPVLPTWLK